MRGVDVLKEQTTVLCRSAILYQFKLHHNQQTKKKRNVNYNPPTPATTFAFVEKAVHCTHKLSDRKHVAELIELATFCLL